MRSPKTLLLVLVALVGSCAALAVGGCASARPNRDPTGERFPSVEGETLEGRDVRVPEDFRGAPVLLIVGYVQDAQFDVDRWLLGLLQGGVDVPVRELPTIEGLLPGVFAGSIDEGMRGGIPSEDWGSVITVYGDAGRIVAFTGNTNPSTARVLLLDGDGRVVWYHDGGYSARLVPELEEALRRARSGLGPRDA